MEEDKNGDCYVGSVQYLFGNHCGVSGKKAMRNQKMLPIITIGTDQF